MAFLPKIGLGFRCPKKWESPALYSRNFAPEEVTEFAQEAGFTVEESKLIGKDTNAVWVTGRKAMSEDRQDES